MLVLGRIISCTINALSGGRFNEPFSARVGRNSIHGGWFWGTIERVVDSLFINEEKHCFRTFVHHKKLQRSNKKFTEWIRSDYNAR